MRYRTFLSLPFLAWLGCAQPEPAVQREYLQDVPCFPEAVVERGQQYLGIGYVAETMRFASNDCAYVVFYSPEDDIAAAGMVCRNAFSYSGTLGVDLAASDPDMRPDRGLNFSFSRLARAKREHALLEAVASRGLSEQAFSQVSGVKTRMSDRIPEYFSAIERLECGREYAAR